MKRVSKEPVNWCMKDNRNFPTEAIEELLDMAIKGIVPNGEFSDLECCIWESFRHVLRNNNLGKEI